MNNQIETIMALITAAIKLYAYHATDDVMVVDDGKAINAVKAALEAALKPGEPYGYVFQTKEEDMEDGMCGELYYTHPTSNMVPLYTAPPAQTPVWKKYINQAEYENHTYLSQPVTIRNPAQTPPPRLTDDDLMAAHCGGKDMVDGLRAIETAVRKQAGWE